MKLHELSPAEGSKKAVKRIGRGPASGQGKTRAKAIRVRRLAQAEVCAPDLKAAECLYRETYSQERSLTNIFR